MWLGGQYCPHRLLLIWTKQTFLHHAVFVTLGSKVPFAAERTKVSFGEGFPMRAAA